MVEAEFDIKVIHFFFKNDTSNRASFQNIHKLVFLLFKILVVFYGYGFAMRFKF